MVDVGRVGLIPKGPWNVSTQYEVLDVVYYNNATYIAKKSTTGNVPSNNSEFWQFACSMPPGDNFIYTDSKATSSQLGIVKPDGTTITVNENGVLSVPQATVASNGICKPDDSTLGVTNNGTLSIKAEYTRQVLNGISGKADSMELDEDNLELKLLSDGAEISSVSLRNFKGDTYELTENDKIEIGQIALSSYTPSDADISRIAAAYEPSESDKADIASMITFSDEDIARISEAYELTEAEKNEIVASVVALIGTADTTDY